MGNTPDTGVEPVSRKEKWLLSGERRRRSRSLGGGCRRKDSGNRDPRSNPRGGRGHGKRSHRRSGIDGLRDVTEEAALIGMAMRAGRSLLLAGRAAGRYRTPLRRTEAIGVHGKNRHTRREDLRQDQFLDRSLLGLSWLGDEGHKGNGKCERTGALRVKSLHGKYS